MPFLFLLSVLLFACTHDPIESALKTRPLAEFIPMAGAPKDLSITLVTQPKTTGIGDAIIVKFPNGENMLIDTGVPDAWKKDLVPALEELKIKELHYLVITHNHYDHAGSASKVIERYFSSLKEVWTNGSDLKVDYLQTAKKYNVPVRMPKRGDLVELGLINLEVMNPKAGYFAKDENDNSIVFKMTHGDFTMLFTGDIEYEAGDALAAIYGAKLHSTVFKVAHHGSAKFSSKFVELVRPEAAVCSCRTIPAPSRSLQKLLKKMGTEWYSNRDLRSATVEAGRDGKYIVGAL